MRMNWLSILTGFTGLGSWWGMWLDMAVGLVSTFPVLALMQVAVPSIPAAVALCIGLAFAGSVCGVFIGSISGAGLAFITLLLRRFFYTTLQYRALMLVNTLIATFVMSFYLVASMTGFYGGNRRVDLLTVMIPVTIATLAACYYSQKLADWYLQNERGRKKKRSPAPAELKREGWFDLHPPLSDDLDEQEHQQRHIHADEDV